MGRQRRKTREPRDMTVHSIFQTGRRIDEALVCSAVREDLWRGNLQRGVVFHLRRVGVLPPLLLVQRYDIPLLQRLRVRMAQRRAHRA